jgi:hypothetical protein
MIISYKYKFICLNPAKTGSGFRENLFLHYNKHLECEYFLDLHENRHPNLKYIYNKIDLKDYFVFTFVRNPWERAASWLSMLINQERSKVNFIDDQIYERIKIFGPQASYYTYNNFRANFIGDCCNQNQQLSYLNEKLNLKLNNIPLINKESITEDKKSLYKSYFNKGSIDKISELEKDVINLKKYTFDLL